MGNDYNRQGYPQQTPNPNSYGQTHGHDNPYTNNNQNTPYNIPTQPNAYGNQQAYGANNQNPYGLGKNPNTTPGTHPAYGQQNYGHIPTNYQIPTQFPPNNPTYPTYPQQGANPYAQPQTGYPQTGYPQTNYPHTSYPQISQPQSGYPQTGYPQTYGANQSIPSQHYGQQQTPLQGQLNTNQKNNLMKNVLINYADTIFVKHDANQSGYLDVNEIYPAICEVFALCGLPLPSHSDVLLLMKNFDKDGNGLLDKGEFRSFLLLINDF